MRGRGAAPGFGPPGVGAPGAARGRERRRAAGSARAMQRAEGAAWGASPAGLGRAHRQRAGPQGAVELGGRWSEDSQFGTASKRNRGAWRAGREVYLGDLQGKAPTWYEAGGLDHGNKKRLCWRGWAVGLSEWRVIDCRQLVSGD